VTIAHRFRNIATQRTSEGMSEISPPDVPLEDFFLDHAGELRIIILRRMKISQHPNLTVN